MSGNCRSVRYRTFATINFEQRKIDDSRAITRRALFVSTTGVQYINTGRSKAIDTVVVLKTNGRTVFSGRRGVIGERIEVSRETSTGRRNASDNKKNFVQVRKIFPKKKKNFTKFTSSRDSVLIDFNSGLRGRVPITARIVRYRDKRVYVRFTLPVVRHGRTRRSKKLRIPPRRMIYSKIT